MRDATGISRRSVGFRRAVAVQISTGAAPVLRVINRSETQSVNEQPKSLGPVFSAHFSLDCHDARIW